MQPLPSTFTFKPSSSFMTNFSRDSTDEGYDEQKFEIPAFMVGWSEEQRAEFAFQLLLTLPTSRLSNVHARITPLLHRDFLSHLPYELAIHILSFTDHRTVAHVAQTSKQWSKIAGDQQLWRIFFLRQGWTANFPAMEAYMHACLTNEIELGLNGAASRKKRAAALSGDDGVDSEGLSDVEMDIDNEGDLDSYESMTGGEGSFSSSSSQQHGNPGSSQASSGAGKQANVLGPVSSTAMTRLHAIRRPSIILSRLRRNNIHAVPAVAATANTTASTFGAASTSLSENGHRNQRTLTKSSKLQQPRDLDLPPIPTCSVPNFTSLLPDHQTPLGLPIINWKTLYKNRSLIERHWREGKYQTRELPTHEKTRDGHQEGIYCIQFDENKIVSGSRDNTIKIWDIKTGKCLRTYAKHTASVLCLQYDDEWIVSGSSDTTIIVWRMETGEVLKHLRGHVESVLNLRFDRRYIVSCSKDRTVKIWNAQTGDFIRTLPGHRAAVNAVQFQDNLVVSASGDRTIKLWDLRTGEQLKTFDSHSRGIACVQFDGTRIVSGSSDRTIKVWDVESGNCLSTLPGHTDLVRTLQFDERSGRIISGSYDETVKVWDLKSGRVVADLKDGHTSRVFKLQFNDTKIVSCSQDQKIIVWDFAAGVDTSFLT